MVLVAVRASSAVSVWDALFFLLSTATAALALGLMVRIRRAQLDVIAEMPECAHPFFWAFSFLGDWRDDSYGVKSARQYSPSGN